MCKMDCKSGSNGFLYIAAITANLIMFFSGICFGWPSPCIPKLNGSEDPENNPLPRHITPAEESWIAGGLNFGCMFGPMIAGYISDKLGRKRALLLFSVPMILSYLLIAFGNHVAYYYASRLIVGLGVGSVFVVLPNYLGEIAEDHNRGLLGCLMGVSLTSGVLFAYTLGPFVSIKVFCLVSLIPLLIFLVGFPFVPETPYYLVLISESEAEDSLRKIRSKSRNDVQKELLGIKLHVQKSNATKGSLADLVRSPVLRKGLFVSVGLVLFQQCAGINAVLAYTQSIFDATKSSISPVTSSIIIGTVQVLMNIVTSQVVERLGRKPLLFMSCFLCGIALAALGAYFYLQQHNFEHLESLYWLPISSLVTYVATFNVGIGPLPWTVMAEIFPPNVKSSASALTTVICFVFAFLITYFYPIFALSLGNPQCFWFFSLSAFAGSIFVYIVVPETKGKTLQEIQHLLSGIEEATAV